MLVDTLYGLMEEGLLEKKETVSENSNETVSATEYWLNGELVHRSATVKLKHEPNYFNHR